MPDLVLFQPDIPQNTGTLLRLGACMGTTAHLIEPAGFPLSDHALKRAGMDYLERAALTRHLDWERFESWRANTGRRLLLLSTKAATPFTEFSYQEDDLLLVGRESSGVPSHVHERADARLLIPMAPGMRSLNVAISAAMVLSEALRQLGAFPTPSNL